MNNNINNKKGFKLSYIFIALFLMVLFFITIYLLIMKLDFSSYDMIPDEIKSSDNNTRFSYDVPLDPQSPWPKFRCNALQNGRSQVVPVITDEKPWEYPTGKGIFSSPVIDGDGTIYIGSADHYFYAIKSNGEVKWKFLTGEIIDSSALLDDKGRVYFGSGDGFLYALDRENGELIWKFEAHTPEQLKERDINSFINWFEGNVAMGTDGTLIVPNDNFLTYAIDRDTGKEKFDFLKGDQTWSLPALNPVTNRLFQGSNYFLLENFYSYDAITGKKYWHKGTVGSMVASPLLTSTKESGAVLSGSFDGILRAYSQKNGRQIWKFGARDHIYSSPAQTSNGLIIQASADGTVYALDPNNGEIEWAYDTREPIRSSPAIDSKGRIYFGSGEGKLFCLNPDGTLRWSYLCIDDDRNDLNSSPALGKNAVVIAGENGGIFRIPYDYPLSEAGKNDPRCNLGPEEDLPADGNYMFYTTPFGSLKIEPPKTIEANQSLTFSLFVRKDGDTIKALIDNKSVEVDISGNPEARIDVSADKKFLTIIPEEEWADEEGDELSINIKGKYLVDPIRFGLKHFYGTTGGTFEQKYVFDIPARQPSNMPYKIAEKPGDPTGIIEIGRLSAPLPTILPSYNQIGFDSIHYILGIVEGNDDKAIVWGVGGKLTGEQTTVVDPELNIRFVLEMEYDNGLVNLSTEEGFTLEFNGWDMPYDLFRVSTRVDPQTGESINKTSINAIVKADEIAFYGPFMKILGVSDFNTGLIYASAACDYMPYNDGIQYVPDGVGKVKFITNDESVIAEITNTTLKAEEHNFGVLLIEEESGKPISLNYSKVTSITSSEDGLISKVMIEFSKDRIQNKVKAYYMVDAYPSYMEILDMQ